VSSEGARVIKRFLGFTRSCDTNATATGKFINEYALPTNLNMQKKQEKVQWRSEGLTFNNNYSTSFTNVEEPLYEDSQCLNKRRNDPVCSLMQKR
jgi:hypothetical protein